MKKYILAVLMIFLLCSFVLSCSNGSAKTDPALQSVMDEREKLEHSPYFTPFEGTTSKDGKCSHTRYRTSYDEKYHYRTCNDCGYVIKDEHVRNEKGSTYGITKISGKLYFCEFYKCMNGCSYGRQYTPVTENIED